MAAWLIWVCYAGGLLAVALIGYGIGLGRGRRRERRARAIDDRLQDAVTGLPDHRQAARQLRAGTRSSARPKPPCLL